MPDMPNGTRAPDRDYIPVRIRNAVHRRLKLLAVRRGDTIIDCIEYLVGLGEKEEREGSINGRD